MPSARAIARANATRAQQLLRRLGIDFRRAIGIEAARAGAEVLRAAVVREAPKRTGFMTSHVDIVMARHSPASVTYYVQIGERDYVGKTFYAALVHYGTAHSEANPFMLRAIDQDGDRAIAAVEAAIARAL